MLLHCLDVPFSLVHALTLQSGVRSHDEKILGSILPPDLLDLLGDLVMVSIRQSKVGHHGLKIVSFGIPKTYLENLISRRFSSVNPIHFISRCK